MKLRRDVTVLLCQRCLCFRGFFLKQKIKVVNLSKKFNNLPLIHRTCIYLTGEFLYLKIVKNQTADRARDAITCILKIHVFSPELKNEGTTSTRKYVHDVRP